jgi:pimeloyl-ACP methyl ester carboxylesterase
MRRALSIIALVLAVTATAAAGTAEDAPPTLADACGSTNDLEARAFWLQTYDRVRLYAIEAGSGKTTLVLAHGYPGDLCETLTFAGKMVANGYRVVAFDFRGEGRSQSPSKNPLAYGRDLAAAVAHARRTGAERVFLIGSSYGGAGVVHNTTSLRVDGRVSLSGTRFRRGYGFNNFRGLARIRAPFLYVGTRRDPYTPLKEVLRIFRRIGASDKRKAIYPGGDHGWWIVTRGRYASPSLALVFRWIQVRSS